MYAKYINTNIIFVSCTGQGNGMDNMSVVIQIKIIKHFIIQISQTELDYSNTKVHRSCLKALIDKSLHFYFIVPVLTPYINQ